MDAVTPAEIRLSSAVAAGALAGLRRHGGRVSSAATAFPDAPRPWVDLSTGINPTPWSGRRARAGDLRKLPDPAALQALESTAAASFGADPTCVVAVAGADAGLRLAPVLTGARSIDVVGPTYDGHAEAWSAAGAAVGTVDLAEAARSGAEALAVVNPNNPDGAVCAPAALADGRRSVIVDESFVETDPRLSVAGAGLPRTVVLRSFGKFYGLPGLRLGFLVAEPAVAARARRLVGDWPVGHDAIAVGRAAYAETEWATETRARLLRTARRLDDMLKAAGFTVVGGTSLFRLVRHPDGAARFARLCEQGVLTRPFDHDPTLLRFGLPTGAGWDRLASALDRL